MGMRLRACVGIACAASFAAFAQGRAPNALASALAGLAGEDQVDFVATVNRSLAKDGKPFDDRRMQTLYRVNRDAVRGVTGAERKAVLAEVFATVPRVCLPMIADRFAADLFSRKAGGFGDRGDSFVEFASAALMRISLRCRTADDYPGTRSAFAVIMFLKASEGEPADLRESFMMYIHPGTHRIAREEWIPAALGDDGKPPTYAPIIKAGIRGEEPDHRISLPQGAPEELNRLVGSELRVDHAWDVSGPRPLGVDASIHDDGYGVGSGVWRVPRRHVEPELYLGQML